jgi:hypothetical protein
MKIVHHFHLATLLIVLMVGAVYAQSSTFEQLRLLYTYDKSTPLELEQKDVNDRIRQ